MSQKSNKQNVLRTSAEARLAGGPKKETPIPPAETLLHELHVHQIELEMQNEELQRAQIALEEARDRYIDLYEFAPLGYFTITREGQIAETNLTGAGMLGIEHSKLLQHRFGQFVAAEDVDHWNRHFASVLQHGEGQSCELRIKRGSALFNARLDSRRMDKPGVPPVVRVVVTDVTERRHTEKLLRLASSAFEAQEGVMVTDAHQAILRVNQMFTHVTGYSAEEAIGQPSSMLSSGRHDKSFYQAMWEAIVRDHYWQGEIWNRRKNGEVFPEWLAISAIPGADGHITHYVGVFSDITEQKKIEKALLDARGNLEKKMRKTTTELERLQGEFEEVNTTLKVLLKQRETEKSEAQKELEREMRHVVTPFLQKLRKSSLDPKQARLLGVLEANLQHLVSSYGRADTASSTFKKLTPKEMQIASMVRQGLSTKVIAATLSLSPETVSIHRKNIRKKLGLDSKTANLRSYLMSLTD